MKWIILLSLFAFSNAFNPDHYTVTNGELDRSESFVCPTGTLVIPDNLGVTSIGDDAFHLCTQLTSVVLPEGLTSIGVYPFYGTGLRSVQLPSSLTSVDSSAFDTELNIYGDIGQLPFTSVNYTGLKPNIQNLPTCDDACVEEVCTAGELEGNECYTILDWDILGENGAVTGQGRARCPTDGDLPDEVVHAAMCGMPLTTTIWVDGGDLSAPYYNFFTDADCTAASTGKLTPVTQYMFKRCGDATDHPFAVDSGEGITGDQSVTVTTGSSGTVGWKCTNHPIMAGDFCVGTVRDVCGVCNGDGSTCCTDDNACNYRAEDVCNYDCVSVPEGDGSCNPEVSFLEAPAFAWAKDGKCETGSVEMITGDCSLTKCAEKCKTSYSGSWGATEDYLGFSWKMLISMTWSGVSMEGRCYCEKRPSDSNDCAAAGDTDYTRYDFVASSDCDASSGVGYSVGALVHDASVKVTCLPGYIGSSLVTCNDGALTGEPSCTARKPDADFADPSLRQAAREDLKQKLVSDRGIPARTSGLSDEARKNERQTAKTSRRSFMKERGAVSWKDYVIEDDTDYAGYTDKVLTKRAKGKLKPVRNIKYRLAPAGLDCDVTAADLELEVGGIESIDLEVDACVSVKVAGEDDIVRIEDSGGSLNIKCNDDLSVGLQAGDTFSCGGEWDIGSLTIDTTGGCVANASPDGDGCECNTGYAGADTDDDGEVDACCADADGDGVCNEVDDCPGANAIAQCGGSYTFKDVEYTQTETITEHNGEPLQGCGAGMVITIHPVETETETVCGSGTLDWVGGVHEYNTDDASSLSSSFEHTTDCVSTLTLIAGTVDCKGDCGGSALDGDGDGVCDDDEVLGCTDPTASNYNTSATEDDGSCVADTTGDDSGDGDAAPAGPDTCPEDTTGFTPAQYINAQCCKCPSS